MYVNVAYPLNATWLDFPDDESLSIEIFMMGCEHNCKNCQSPDFKNPNHSENTKLIQVDELIEETVSLAKRNYTNKIVLCGGDPLCAFNVEQTKYITDKLKLFGFEICIYTGYSIDYVKQKQVNSFDFLKSGLYLEQYNQISEKTDTYMKFASTNQKLFDKNFNVLSDNGTYYFQERIC